jgi:hypothetical protein
MPWAAQISSPTKDASNVNILLTFDFTNADTGESQTRVVPSSTWDAAAIAAYAQIIIAQLDARDAAFAAIQTGAVAMPSGVTTALQAVWSLTALPTDASGDAFADGDTAAQKLVKLNAWTVAGPKQDVPFSSVIGYLGLQGKTAMLQAFAKTAQAVESGSQTPAQVAAISLVSTLANPNAQVFRTADDTVYAAIGTMLTALVSDEGTGLTADDKTALLALADSTLPWWKFVGSAAPFSTSVVAAASLS